MQGSMRDGYVACANESGSGSFMRMKEHMSRHTKAMRSRMFSQATSKLQEEIEALVRETKDKFGSEISTLLLSLPQPFSILWWVPN